MRDPHQAPRQEIHLPLHEPALSRPPRTRPGVSNLGLALIAMLATAAAALVWFPAQSPAAEEAVRSFLEDVRAGDVEAALEWSEEAPGGPFLVPEALDSDWVIIEVAQVGYGHDGGDRTAEVYAEIRAHDGTRLAHRYKVGFDSGEPLILDNLNDSLFSSEGAIEVNGVIGPAERVYLLPGVYHFYGSMTPEIDMNMPPMLVLGGRVVELGGEQATDRLTEPRPEFTAEGQAAVAEALHDHFDACAVSRNEGCPFGRLSEDSLFVEADPSEPWRVIAYPEVAVESWLPEAVLRLRTIEKGAVELDVVPANSGDGAEPTTASCAFGADGVALFLDSENGSVGVVSAAVEPPRCEWLAG